jgi:hypothetical protein
VSRRRMSKMHAGEADIDAALVGRLIAEQFLRWAGLPISGSSTEDRG